MGHLNIDPVRLELVEEIVNGQVSLSTESFDRDRVDESYILKAIVEKDGTEHSPGGGVDMVPLELPKLRLLERTRLQHDIQSGEKFRCERCNIATRSSGVMAAHLVEPGAENSVFAEYLLSIDDYHGRDRCCMTAKSEFVDLN